MILKLKKCQANWEPNYENKTIEQVIELLRQMCQKDSIYKEEMDDVVDIIDRNIFCNELEIQQFCREQFGKEVSRWSYRDTCNQMVRQYYLQDEQI